MIRQQSVVCSVAFFYVLKLKPVICRRARVCVCHLELSDLIAQGRYLAFHDVVEIELHIVPT